MISVKRLRALAVGAADLVLVEVRSFFSEKGHMFNKLGSCINKSRDLVQSHEYI